MFLLSLGVKQIPTVLPSLALALLTGLNASAVGLIFYAGYQLAKMTSTDALTRLILFASASIASCYSAIWLFPVLTVAGGLVTLVGDWKGWGRAKMAIQEKRRKRKGETGSDAEDDGDARSARQDDAIALEELNHGGIEEPVITPLTRVATSHSGSNSKPTSLRIPTPPPSPTGLRRRNVPVPVTTSVVEVAATPERTPINFHLSIAQSSAIVACFFTILIAILVLNGTLSAPTRALQLFSNLLTAGSILFGGGPVVVPLLQVRFPLHSSQFRSLTTRNRDTLSILAGSRLRTSFSDSPVSFPPSQQLEPANDLLPSPPSLPRPQLQLCRLPRSPLVRPCFPPLAESHQPPPQAPWEPRPRWRPRLYRHLHSGHHAQICHAPYLLQVPRTPHRPLNAPRTQQRRFRTSLDRRLPFVPSFLPLLARMELTKDAGLWKVGLLTGTGTASLEKSGYWATIAGAAFVASESFGIPPPASILGGALAGLIYGGVIGAP